MEIRRNKNLFPTDLEKRLDAILNVVNTELKSVTLMNLDDVPISANEIRKRVRKASGRGYLPGNATFSGYCNNTLIPIGMVAREEVITDDGDVELIGYALTEAGRKFRCVAAFSLDYALKNQISMFKILASTVSSGKNRSPGNRIRILEALKDRSLRETDLSERLGLNITIFLPHLRDFVEIGFIKYESIGEIQYDSLKYKWSGKNIEEIKPVRKMPNLTKKIADIFLENQDFLSCKEVSKLVNHTNYSNVSRILLGLLKQNFLERKEWGREIKSEINLLDKGRKFLDEYIVLIREAMAEGPALDKLSKFYDFLIENPEKLRQTQRNSIDLYRSVSPIINKKPTEETNRRIINYIKSNPGVRGVDLEKYLELKYLSRNIKPFLISGKIRKEKKGREARYYPN